MNKSAALLGLVCLTAGLLAGYVLFGGVGTGGTMVETSAPIPLFYRHPMNPEVTSPVPAKGSMGMDYVPVYAAAESSSVPGTVKIDPTIQSNIGLRTALAVRKPLSRSIRAPGRVDYDEERLVRLHPKVEGWIKDIRVDKTGQPVADNDILLTIYSPKLVATQQEFLLALKNQEALQDSSFDDIRQGADALVKSSRERLALLDVPEHQVQELEQSGMVKQGLHIHAPAGGTVLKIGARHGQYVTPGTELYLIADLSRVWVYADIYDYELPWVKVGDKVEMTLASVPGKVFDGELAYLYPYAEAKTRTTKVRLVFENPNFSLRPEMFAEVTIKASERSDQVVVPAEAVIRSGAYNQMFVLLEGGQLEPRTVVLGVESRGEVAVLSGISAGERVVVSGQFLIDSESRLREATAKMMAPEADKPRQAAHRSDEGMTHD